MTEHDPTADAVLAQVAEGQLRAFAGLLADHDRAAMQRVFDPGGDEAPETAGLLDGIAVWRRAFPPCPLAPNGLTVAFDEAGLAVHVTVAEPELTEPADDQLGPPARILDSGLSSWTDLLVWPDRGVLLHRHRYRPVGGRLDLVRAMEIDQLLASSVATVRVTRRRR